MNEPLVSIIIPVYNGKNYLREAIDSSIAQTYTNIEIIVVNDGSNDNGATEEIALSYGDKIRYFYKNNGGVATALNLGIQKMKGDYFSWLSHDDMYYPNKIERQMKALNKHNDMTAIIYGDYDLLHVSTKTITHVNQSIMYSIDQLTNSVFPVLQGLIHGCSLLIHKSHFNRAGMFSESLITTQDYDLWFRMFRYQKMIYINEPLILSRVHDEQGSRTLSCHNYERYQLYMNFINSLTEDEICSMYGSLYNFYHRMCCFFKGLKINEAYSYANQKLQEANIPENLMEQISVLKKCISRISNGNANRICIFCAGEYGIRLYQELYCKLIPVDCFSDNDTEKWGEFFNNVYCIPPKQLEKDKEHMLVIVATRTPTEIVTQLKSKGFPYVITKQEIDRILFNIPPIKWITALDCIEGLDYSSKDTLLVINKFNQTIYDMCKYYEERM